MKNFLFYVLLFIYFIIFLSSDFSESSISRWRLSYSLLLLCFVAGIFTLFWYRYLYLVTKYPNLQLFFSLVHNCGFQCIFPSFGESKNLTQTRQNCAVFIKDTKIVLYFQKDTMIVPSLQKDIKIVASLTALVPSSHRRDEKKYVATGRRITDTLKEQKRSRCKQSTLLIKDFKYGSSLSIFVLKK